MNIKRISFPVFALSVITLALGLWSITQAVGNNEKITVCVSKAGAMRIKDKQQCKNNEHELSWNIKGERGEQGEPGLPAGHSAGNIAFMWGIHLLKTDGTVWIANRGNVPPTRITGEGDGVGSVPVPVEDIVDWAYLSLVDKDGNFWFIDHGNVEAGWQNFGTLP